MPEKEYPLEPIKGYEMIERKAGKSGNGGYLYVPKTWVGKKVRAVLLEPVEPDNK